MAETSSKITPEQVKEVAKLARLALNPDAIQLFSSQLEGILGYVDQLKKLETQGVEPMAHALPLANVLREDVVQEGLSLEQVLRNAPERDGAFFKVPKVIGGDEDSAG